MTTATETPTKRTAKKATAPPPEPPQSDQDRLLEPFPADWIGKLPRITCRDCSQNRSGTCDRHERKSKCAECGNWITPGHLHLDYVGHADVTRRLLQVDPAWSWEPLAFDPETGLPRRDEYGGMWIKLTVHLDGEPVTRLGYGDAQGKTGPNAVKEVIGDGLRNAAMRFGVALDLWAKGDRATPADPHSSSAGGPPKEQPQGDEVGQRRQTRTAKKAAAPAEQPADQPDAEPQRDPEAEARAHAAVAACTKARDASDLAGLKAVWDGAKDAGLLQIEVAHPTTSELMALQTYITERKTELDQAS